jgi:hypothetical protein
MCLPLFYTCTLRAFVASAGVACDPLALSCLSSPQAPYPSPRPKGQVSLTPLRLLFPQSLRTLREPYIVPRKPSKRGRNCREGQGPYPACSRGTQRRTGPCGDRFASACVSGCVSCLSAVISAAVRCLTAPAAIRTMRKSSATFQPLSLVYISRRLVRLDGNRT